MNTHSYLKNYLVITFLIGFSSLYSQHSNPQVKMVSHYASENFTENDAYDIENEGLIASDFAKTRTVAARLRLKEEQRNAARVRNQVFKLIQSSEEKIGTAKQKLVAAKKAGSLSQQSIHQQEISIKNAEEKLRQLKNSIQMLSAKTSKKMS